LYGPFVPLIPHGDLLPGVDRSHETMGIQTEKQFWLCQVLFRSSIVTNPAQILRVQTNLQSKLRCSHHVSQDTAVLNQAKETTLEKPMDHGEVSDAV
jgi:hypothetical protein